MAPRFERKDDAGALIRGFDRDGRFRVGEQAHAAVLLTPERAITWDAPALADLGEADLAELLALEPKPEFVLIGTGPALVRPPAALTEALAGRGIGVEAMDSRAAARTWAVLRAEQRWIAAALLPL